MRKCCFVKNSFGSIFFIILDRTCRSDLQTLRLENENLAMEKSELNLKLKQMKTELLEKEVRFNSEIQKLRSDLRLKETELKKIAEEHQLDRDVLVSSYKVYIS